MVILKELVFYSTLKALGGHTPLITTQLCSTAHAWSTWEKSMHGRVMCSKKIDHVWPNLVPKLCPLGISSFSLHKNESQIVTGTSWGLSLKRPTVSLDRVSLYSLHYCFTPNKLSRIFCKSVWAFPLYFFPSRDHHHWQQSGLKKKKNTLQIFNLFPGSLFWPSRVIAHRWNTKLKTNFRERSLRSSCWRPWVQIQGFGLFLDRSGNMVEKEHDTRKPRALDRQAGRGTQE